MAIDPKLVSIKTAGELPVSDPSDNANFLFYEGEALKRSPMSNIYDKVSSGLLSATTATVPATTGFERYIVHEAGIYTNFLSGGSPIEVTSADLDIVSGVARNEVVLEVNEGVATKRVTRKIGETGTANYNTGTLSPTSIDKAETGKTVSEFVAKTKTDYENLVPDNIFMGGIGFFENQPTTVKTSVMTLTLEDFANPFRSKSLKYVGTSVTANSNFGGIQVDISGKIEEGQTLGFKGLVYPTATGMYVETRFRDAAGVQIGAATTVTGLTQNQWNEVNFEIVVPAGAKLVNVFARNSPAGVPFYVTAWDIHKKNRSNYNLPENNAAGVASAE